MLSGFRGALLCRQQAPLVRVWSPGWCPQQTLHKSPKLQGNPSAFEPSGWTLPGRNQLSEGLVAAHPWHAASCCAVSAAGIPGKRLPPISAPHLDVLALPRSCPLPAAQSLPPAPSCSPRALGPPAPHLRPEAGWTGPCCRTQSPCGAHAISEAAHTARHCTCRSTCKAAEGAAFNLLIC